MDDLTAFLNARLDEDEAYARDPGRWNEYDPGDPGEPARVLREVEVKRHLIAEHEDAHGGYSPAHFDGYWDAIWRFAAIYSDHPDYQAEWDYRAP